MTRFAWVFLAVGVGVAAAVPPAATAQLSVGVVVDRDGLRHMHLAVGQYYGYPVQTVTRWHRSWLHADELPVVYLLAHEAHVSPDVVIALRERGWSWLDISYHLGVDPYVFIAYLPDRRYVSAWGPSYGYWTKIHRRDLRRLTDRRIVDYVNVVFWAHVHHRPVREIIVIRERVPTWTHYVRVEAPRVRVQEVARARPPGTYAQSTPRPAQPRATQRAPAAARAPAQSPNRAPSVSRTPAQGRTVPQASRAPNTQRTPPAASRAPAASRTPNAAPRRAPAPAAQQRAPAASRAPTPAARSNAPSASRNNPPAASRAPAASSRTPAAQQRAPAVQRAPAPAARNNTPAAARSNNPPAARNNAPAASRAPATRNNPPAASRAPAASSRTPAAQQQRPAAARNNNPPARRGGGN